MLTLGRVRGLQECADESGRFSMVAIDQRLNMARLVDAGAPERVPFTALRDVKVDLCRVFTRRASAVLVDVEYGLGDVVRSGAFSGHCGLLVAVEEGPNPGGPARLREGWGVAKVKAAGASGVKLLVHYHPDDRLVAAQQRDLVARVVEECRAADLPAVVEPVSYGLRSPAEKPDVVVRTAEDLVPLGMDLYKAEFPTDLAADPDEAAAARWCRRLDAACGETPWVILSAGAAMGIFERQVAIACANGASGFLAGRALWQDAVRERDPERRRARLETEAAANFDRVAALVAELATPWTSKARLEERAQPVPEGWFRDYRAG